MANHTSRGQQRDKPFRDALRMEEKLAENGEDTPAKPGSLRYIARQLLIRAGTDTQAAKEVGDRLDGKPAQAIVGDAEFDPVDMVTRIEIVAPDVNKAD
jgi:hypothetical protein